MTGYPSDRIYEEAAFIAYYCHWPHDDIMAMDHREGQKWVEEISRINRKTFTHIFFSDLIVTCMTIFLIDIFIIPEIYATLSEDLRC